MDSGPELQGGSDRANCTKRGRLQDGHVQNIQELTSGLAVLRETSMVRSTEGRCAIALPETIEISLNTDQVAGELTILMVTLAIPFVFGAITGKVVTGASGGQVLAQVARDWPARAIAER